jgi:hypothetical protein
MVLWEYVSGGAYVLAGGVFDPLPLLHESVMTHTRGPMQGCHIHLLQQHGLSQQAEVCVGSGGGVDSGNTPMLECQTLFPPPQTQNYRSQG